MNLRILVYSNPLICDKIGKSFTYYKDSGFIYSKQLIKSLPAGWRFYWCIPDKLKKEDEQWFLEANKNIELIRYPYSTSIHQNRYNFSVNTLNKYFTYGYDIDAILNNQPEVASNLRVWAENQRREKPIIFSFYHWIDCKESQTFGEDLAGYGVRQADGAKDSDYIMFHNYYAYDMFMREAYKNMNPKYIENFGEKWNLFHPAPTIFGSEKFDIGIPEGKKIILFNHRLNNTTCWKEVLKVLDDIYKDRQDFVLWITDDSKMKEFENLRSREYIKIKSLKDSEYGYILRRSHFSICNHKGYSTWNMAVIDSFANECLALIPNREVYSNMFRNSIKFFGDEFTHDGDWNLKEQIIKLLDNSRETNKKICIKVIEKDLDLFAFKDNIIIKDFIMQKITEDAKTTPKKYDEVLKYILSHNKAYKKEWANEFWQFHVNSNFLKIRRKLLMEENIFDDTSSSETCYLTKR